MESSTHIAWQLLHKKGSGYYVSFPTLQTNKKRELVKDQAVLESFKTQWLLNCLCALRCAEGRSIRWASPASAGAAGRHGQMGCLPGTKPKDAEYLRVVWPLAVSCGSRRKSGCRNLGLCFRNITWKVSGPAARRYEIPHFIYARRRGKAGDPTAPSLLAPGARGPPASLPGAGARWGSHPFPTRASQAPSRLQAPRTPARAPSGAGRWATVAAAAHRELGGIFPYFFPPFPHLRAAHCPHCSW